MLKARPVPYEPFEPHLPAPAEPVRAEEVLTLSEIRERLAARERSVGDRLSALRAEVTRIDDVTIAGRPALDHVRAHPVGALASAVAVGALVGVVAGLLGRAMRGEEDEQESVMRMLTTSVVDDAARRVALGDDPQRALQRVVRRRAPMVSYTPPAPAAAGAIRSSFDMALKSAVGFGLKAGLDMLTKQLTGKPEVLGAVSDASESGPSVSRTS